MKLIILLFIIAKIYIILKNEYPIEFLMKGAYVLQINFQLIFKNVISKQ